jgi:UDP-2,3-diacylglucosamine pyrophosphatase LpxH
MKFKKAKRTLILSDIHLSVPEPRTHLRPLWKKFSREEYFIDHHFAKLLNLASLKHKKGLELILAGDIFDFDSVLQTPQNPSFSVNWLERLRGLNSEEEKSLYKISLIIAQHPVFIDALSQFIKRQNKIIFIVGNHDLELHWEKVQKAIMQSLKLSVEEEEAVRFCNWFYISNGDTLVEHGNQYDPYCCILNPIKPFFDHGNAAFVKIPFGNLTHRYMINGMGIFNPHVDSTFLLSFRGYVEFYINTIRTQPFLLFAWFFGAMTTLLVSIFDGVAPQIKSPLGLEDRYAGLAKRSNTTPAILRALRELHAHPISWNPFRIMRVLWLDRALLFAVMVNVALLVASFWHLIFGSGLWLFLPVLLIISPLYIQYVKKVKTVTPVSKYMITPKVAVEAAQIAKVMRLVCGHTHEPEHQFYEGIEYLNAGYWSPSFKDVECTKWEKNRSFVWIYPEGKNRKATIYYWDDVAEDPHLFD